MTTSPPPGSSMDCAQLGELAAEVALGTISGDERAPALDHLAGCARCRQLVAELAQIADGLTALVPPIEPPAGFQARVLARLPSPSLPFLADRTPTGPRRKRRPRWLAPAAAAVTALTAALGSGLIIHGSGATDRAQATQYRHLLSAGHGASIRAWPLDSGGAVFIYRGAPSWMFLTLDPSHGYGSYRCDLLLRDGHRLPMGTFDTTNYASGWGRALPVNVDAITAVQIHNLTDGTTFTTTLDRS